MNKNSNAVTKPFPWKCSNCKAKAVREAIVTHEVDIEHDGCTYHVTIENLKTPQCTNCGLVHPDAKANEAITLAFLTQAQLLTPEQIRGEREKLGLTQKQLAACLRVVEATVSRWETGGQIQQRAMDLLLRGFFHVPEVRRYYASVAGLSTPNTVTNTPMAVQGST